MTNIAQAISHLPYFFGEDGMSLFPEIATIGRLEDAVPLSLRNRSCPLSSPKRNRKRLHGRSPFRAGDGWDKPSSPKLRPENPPQAARARGRDRFAFVLVVAAGVGGGSIPFIAAQRGHPLQEGCRQPSLLSWSSGAGAGGRKLISPRLNSLNNRWQQPALFFL